ncbi:MAG: class I SAM-dependent methyltransferase, partial [Pseudomonadales bacterium]
AKAKSKIAKVSKLGFRALIESLESAVRKLHWKTADTEWGNYYAATNYADAAMEHKKKLVDEFVAAVSPAPTRIQDLGANTGVFSQIAARHCDTVISQDVDPSAVEQNYRRCVDAGETGILPLQLDLTTPSPGIGWANAERAAFMDRASADTVMALALIHHLAISNNLPLPKVADFFRQIAAYLIIEFVPKSDSQVKRLLTTREDIFPEYTQQGFETTFTQCFTILKQAQIEGSDRVLYLLQRVDGP